MKFARLSIARFLRVKSLGLIVLGCLMGPFLCAMAAPPSVNIVTPASGTVAFAPAALVIAATASDDGAVTNISFLVNGMMASNPLNEPFLTLSNPAAGSYVFRAVATDDGSLAATSAPVSIEVITNAVVGAGPMVLNRNNGLFEQYVNVTNRTSEIWPNGVRLSVYDIGSTNRLWMPTGTNAGVPYLDKMVAVPPGGSVQFLVQYYLPNPRLLPTPTYVGVPLPFSRVQQVPQITSATPVGNVFSFTFTSEIGRFYFIQSTDDFVTWKTKPTAVLGTGGTIIAPESGTGRGRFFRVVLVP